MTPPPLVDRLIELAGTVQGVGFRPCVARLAARSHIRGWVRNDRAGVSIRAVATADVIARFIEMLVDELPDASRIVELHERPTTDHDRFPPAPEVGFSILDSAEAGGPPTVAITPDLALCAECRREISDLSDRRFGYAFTNCTQCGPRYTIIEAVPYDRARTTMAAFEMCPACQAEFNDPANRRFHAQPNACPTCGPEVQLCDQGGTILAERQAAVAAAAAALREGRIVAVKGIGGFHLTCDAANATAVEELRGRKLRDAKPFAVMFPSLEAVQAMAEVDAEAAAALTSSVAPIVLVPRRPGAEIAASVAPGNPFIGALLPYSPLHVLLTAAVGRPLVATSGNLAEEPLCTDNEEARARLQGIADLFLMHNRAIAHPIDDSIMRPARGGAVWLRRARGRAPTPLPLPRGLVRPDALLAVGGQMKNTIALTVGANLVLSPHLGDLENPISIAAFRRTVDLLGSLHGRAFERVACDAHPDYASTQFAESLGLPVVSVQHHLAHILACLLEHDGGPPRVLGVAWDGTGYGCDGAIWGGEFIVVDRVAGTARRVAHLRPFHLPGGAAAVREPRRSALGIWYDIEGDPALHFDRLAAAGGFSPTESATLHRLLRLGRHAPVTTSAGRLFDAAAALLGLSWKSSFEGEAAMALEFAARRATISPEPSLVPLTDQDPDAFQLDWRPLMIDLARNSKHTDPAVLAARFHITLAHAIAATAAAVGVETVVLTGGCFQNTLLLEQTTRALEQIGHIVLRHRALPPNDGSLAAGQALGALWGISRVANSLTRHGAPPSGAD